jgi:Polyketide cyclase / dehydrase and lipid transport
MTVVVCAEDMLGTPEQAERLWHDAARWGAFIEGFGAVQRTQGQWPDSGSVLEWTSTPRGRGHVTERMLEHQPARRAVSEIADDRLEGTRTVSFVQQADAPNAIRVSVELDYRLKGPLWRHLAIDWLFIRRAMRDSIQRELESFACELEGA